MPLTVAALEQRGALGEPPRHGENERHGHVGGVFGEHARRVGDDDAAVPRRLEVDIVDAGAELGDQFELRAGLAQYAPVDAVGHRGDEHVGGLHRFDQLFPGKGRVIKIEPRIEQLAKPGFHHVRQLARDNN